MQNLIEATQAAKMAGVSLRTIRNWQKARAISYVKINAVVRFHPETFMAEVLRFTHPARKSSV
jgi:hypothetical protein